jgi:hypothetical protein
VSSIRRPPVVLYVLRLFFSAGIKPCFDRVIIIMSVCRDYYQVIRSIMITQQCLGLLCGSSATDTDLVMVIVMAKEIMDLGGAWNR